MRKVIFGVLFVVMALGVGGCSIKRHSGTVEILNQRVIDKLVINETTKTEASTWLGKPSSARSSAKAGTSTWTYSAFQTTRNSFSGRGKQEQSSLILIFDKNEILIDKQMSDSSVNF